MPKIIIVWLTAALATGLFAQNTQPAVDPKTETIVLIRHAEKPLLGFGQINCQGLNRALALPDVLINKFGKAGLIYAPNPADKVSDPGGTFDYIRPLITIEPTAVRLGLPVNCDFGYKDIKGMEAELLSPAHAGKLIFVVWEHEKLNDMVKDLLRTNGADPGQVPDWPGSDYDRIYVLRFSAVTHTISFTLDHESLDHLSDDCPSGK